MPCTGTSALISSTVGSAGMTAGLGGRESGLVRRILSFLACLLPSLISASLPAALVGEVGREIVLAEEKVSPLGCCFFGFLTREDSLPLASERLGEPGLLRMPLRKGSELLIILEGVPGVLVGAAVADAELLPFSAACFSSSLFFSSSFWRSTSLSSESLCLLLV